MWLGRSSRAIPWGRELVSVQLSLFANEAQLKEQRRLLEMLVLLKTDEIETRTYRGFFGTSEACLAKKAEVDEKVRRFVREVDRVFPGVLAHETCG